MELQTETTATDRMQALVEALRKVATLQGLNDEEYLWLAERGIERFDEGGATLFQEGDPATTMTIILKGEIQVQRERGMGALFIGRAGADHRPAAVFAHEAVWWARLHGVADLVAGV